MPKIVTASTAQKVAPKPTGKEATSLVKSEAQPKIIGLPRDVNQWALEVKRLFGIPIGECMAEHSMLNAIGTRMSLYDCDELLKVLRVFKNRGIRE